MNLVRRLAILSLISTYLLIFIGGLVRVSGAGLGCPDWPKCFGGWIPPMHVSELPPDIDPTTFNITLAWIEYGNRFIGVLVGFLIVGLALSAIINLRKQKRIVWLCILSAVLVAFQGWQGSIVVSSALHPLVVTLHLLLALILASLLVWIVTLIDQLGSSARASNSLPASVNKARLWLGGLWLAGLIQIILGTQVRGALDTIMQDVPLLSSSDWLRRTGALHLVHALAGFGVVFYTIIAAFVVKKLLPSNRVRQLLAALVIVALLQLVTGFSFFAFGLAPLTKLFHLWLATIYIGLTLRIYSRSAVKEAEASQTFTLRPFLACGFLVLMGFTAWGVIGQAEKSRTDLPIIHTVPQFSFVDQNGSPFSRDSLLGRLHVVDFFFTLCKGICPPMNGEIRKLYDHYNYSDKVRFVSFSVDPDNDSLPALKEYANDMGVYDSRWRFLRHDSVSVISELCEKGFLVSGELPGGHSGWLMLLDQDAQIRELYDFGDTADIRLLKTHIESLAATLPARVNAEEK